MEDVKKPTDEKSTPTTEQLNINSEAPPPEKAPLEAAALAQDNQATQSTEKPAPEKNDKVVNYDFNQKAQTLQSKSSEAQEKPPQGSKVAEAPEKPKVEKPPEKQPTPRGRPPSSKQADSPNKKPKAEKAPKPEAKPKPKPEKTAKEKSDASVGGGKAKTPQERTEALAKAAIEKFEAPPPPPKPTTAPRTGEQEQIVYINLSELHPFKDHSFQVKQDAEMAAMVESVKDKGVTQPAIVRPREDGGYELVSGHRRHMASELSNYTNMPCIVRNLTDEQAITQMVEDNTNQRDSILPSERGAALKMQLEAIKRQGARDGKKDSISIESQIDFCKYELKGGSCKEYTDKGYSGKNTDRPRFQELVRDIERGLIQRVVVYKLDRISRSIIDFANMMELFQRYNVEFVSSTEKFDTSTPMGRAMLNICIVFAQLERETIQKRVQLHLLRIWCFRF